MPLFLSELTFFSENSEGGLDYENFVETFFGGMIVLVEDMPVYGGSSVTQYAPLYGNDLMTQLAQTGYLNQQFYSFSNHFRIFLPPGMKNFSLLLIADNVAQIVGVSRFGQYPYYTVLPSVYPQGGLSLEDVPVAAISITSPARA